MLVAWRETLLNLVGCSEEPVTFPRGQKLKQVLSRMGGAIRRLFSRYREVTMVSMACWLENVGWHSGKKTSGAAVRDWLPQGEDKDTAVLSGHSVEFVVHA